MWNEQILKNKKGETPKEFCKKIVFTNNPNLIADGVQAIPKYFLDWFLKNPDAELVGIASFQNGFMSCCNNFKSY